MRVSRLRNKVLIIENVVISFLETPLLYEIYAVTQNVVASKQANCQNNNYWNAFRDTKLITSAISNFLKVVCIFENIRFCNNTISPITL